MNEPLRAIQTWAPARARLALLALAALGLLAFAAAAGPTSRASAAAAKTRVTAPRLLAVRCRTRCGTSTKEVAVGGRVRVFGRGLRRGMVVFFRGATRPAARGRVLSSSRLEAVVPRGARSGRIVVRAPGAARSNAAGPIRVLAAPPPAPTVRAPRESSTSAGVLAGNGMWIWYVNKSGGTADAIADQADRYGIRTVYVKSSDGSTEWTQFTPAFVSRLKARGIHVCAWQYVYGTRPDAEAAQGAQAVRKGADCLVIDAEAEYEGRYKAASTYVRALRGAVGADYPLALSSFPYADYHPSFPYSVFLGPGAAQFNLPQMYWKAIGTSVDKVFAHTYANNGIYGRPIEPLGQTYQTPSTGDLQRFRALARGYGADGVSWWDWQETTPAGWAAIGGADPAPAQAPPVVYPTLGRGAKGDQVVWAQTQLGLQADGVYGSSTQAAVREAQTTKGLPATGTLDDATWRAVLAQPVASASAGRASAASTRREPRSASLPARRYEMPPKDHAPAP